MARAVKKRSKKAALPPGTLVHIGERKREHIAITQICYDEAQFEEKPIRDARECFPLRPEPAVTWLNVSGIHDVAVIQEIGNHFELHPLLLEDIVNTDQRPKVEDYERHLYIVLKMLYLQNNGTEIQSEQVSLILGPTYVVTFQEDGLDPLAPIRDRLRHNKGNARKMRADYLAYSMMDAIIDNYFIVLEKTGERLTALDEELLDAPTPQTLGKIHRLQRELLFLRKAVWPVREVLGHLERGGSALIAPPTVIYLRDVYDHVIEVIETVESFRDHGASLLETYVSVISYRANEIMKVLTVIATIFLPLTFIVGLYGMNFAYMPELKWRWGYPAVLFGMMLVTAFMLLYFRRKKWV